MKTKQITIPPFLHDIHGEETTLLDLCLTYAGGLISLASVIALYAQLELEMAWWKLVLLALVSADIGAGAVANFTKGTNQYYSGKHKKKTRTIFILTHFIHPAVFLFLLDSYSVSAVTLVGFVILFTLLINAAQDREQQGVLAAFCMVAGVSLLVMLPVSNPFLWWFFPLYMLKLFIAFGIRRFSQPELL